MARRVETLRSHRSDATSQRRLESGLRLRDFAPAAVGIHAGLRALALKEESHHLAGRVGSVGIRKRPAWIAAKPSMRSAVHEPVFDNSPLVVILESRAR